MSEMDLEKSSYSGFERFLYIFFIPIIFTSILTLVLLSLFDYNVMNSVLKAANKIPVVNSIVPDPKPDAEIVNNDPTTETPRRDTSDDESELAIQLNDLRAALLEEQQIRSSREAEIEALTETISELQQMREERLQTEEEYLQQVQSLANTYARMNASKAAQVLENLTLNELVLVLSQMRQEDQVKVLEKMNPRRAAEASILLKDVVVVKDVQIAALQERLELHQQNQGSQTDSLDYAELAQTFANMTAKNAAQVLLEMNKVNQNQVVKILRLMDVQSRANVITAISNESQSEAAKLTAKLAD